MVKDPVVLGADERGHGRRWNGGQRLSRCDSNRGEIAPPGVTLRDLGTHRLKDIRFPETLSDLVIEGLPSHFAPIRSLDNRPNNLPVALTPFIGRTQEKVDLDALLRRDDVRMITLTGAGGTGKTRLSTEAVGAVLDLFVDGVFQILLSTVTEPRLVPPTIAQTLGVPEFAGRPVLETLKHAIANRRMLLVIDNFEQVMAAAPIVVELLGACPKLKVLLTSREALSMPPEREYRVAPLQTPDSGSGIEPASFEAYDAVRLFVDRVRDMHRDFALTADTAPIVAQICRQLDGLPEGEAWTTRALQQTHDLRGTQERAAVLDVAGWLRVISGDWKGALPLFAECRPIFERLEMANAAALSSMAEGITRTAATGDPAGIEQVVAALRQLRALGDAYGTGLTLTALGEGARLGGAPEKAQGHFEEALVCMRAVGNTYWIGALLENLAHVRLQLQDWTGAVSLLKEALELAHEYDYPMMVNHYIAAMGEVALIRDKPVEAARLFGAADAFLRSLGVKFEPTDQAAFEQNITAARALLGPALFDLRLAEGAQWSKAEAIAASISLRS
jgi:hypothetical protein